MSTLAVPELIFICCSAAVHRITFGACKEGEAGGNLP